MSVTDSTMNDHFPTIRKATFRFYEELNDHLPEEQRKRSFAYEFRGKPSIKNTIQAIGVPHGEVDLILVDGEPVDFNYHMQGGEYISVYPVLESFDVSQISHLRSEPLRKIRFVVDVNLGKLAQKLRLLGFDTYFRNDLDDDEIVKMAAEEKRIILTRDKGILKQNKVTHGYFLRNDDPGKQVTEVVERFQLQHLFRPFSRCSNCNGRLETAEKQSLKDKLKTDTFDYYDEFWKCNFCGQIYWKGSHFERILSWIDNLKNRGQSTLPGSMK